MGNKNDGMHGDDGELSPEAIRIKLRQRGVGGGGGGGGGNGAVERRDDGRMKMNVSLPTMLSDVGLRMYKDALLPEDPIGVRKRVKSMRSYALAEEKVTDDLCSCKTKEVRFSSLYRV